jgi:hypothetical protein
MCKPNPEFFAPFVTPLESIFVRPASAVLRVSLLRPQPVSATPTATNVYSPGGNFLKIVLRIRLTSNEFGINESTGRING